VIAVIGFLPSGASPYKITMDQAQWGAVSSGYYDWHEALTWMKDNTPKPDLPYYSIYERPQPGKPYNYSKNDYGVMSWWIMDISLHIGATGSQMRIPSSLALAEVPPICREHQPS